MSIRAAIREISGSLFKKAITAPSTFLSMPTFQQKVSDDLTDPYKQLALVYMVVSANARAISSCDFKIMTGGEQASYFDEPATGTMTRRERRVFHGIEKARISDDHRRRRKERRKAETEVKELEKGPMYELFRRPSENLSTTQFFFIVSQHLLTFGKATVLKLGPNGKPVTGNQIPAELLPIKPTLLKAVYSDDGNRITAWEYSTKNGKKFQFDRKSVIYFRFPDQDNINEGLSPLLAGIVDYKTDFNAAMFNLSFFLNSANPGGVLRMKEGQGSADIDDRNRLENVLNDKHSGYGKRGRWMILDGDAEVDLNTVTHKDMDFLDGRRFTLEILLGTFQTPKFVLSFDNEVNRDTANAALRHWWESTIFCVHHLIEDTLAVDLFIPTTKEAEFGMFDHSMVEALQDNLTEKADLFQKFLASGISPRVVNKKLEVFDEDELGPAADMSFIGGSLTPLDGLLAANDPEQDPNADPNQEDGTDGEVKPNQPDEEDPVPPADDAAEPDKEDAPKKSMSEPIHHKLASAELRDHFWHAKERTIMRPSETLFRSKLQKVLYRMRVETLEKLKVIGGPDSKTVKDLFGPGQIEGILLDREAWSKKMYDSLHPAYTSAMKKSSAQAARETSTPFTFSEQDPAVTAVLQARELELKNVTQGIIDSIKKNLIASAQNGDTTSETAAKIRALFNEMSIGRSIRIARTESAISVENARQIVFEDAGIDKIMWVTARDNFVRESHQIDGQVRIRGEEFTNGLRWPLDYEDTPGPEEVVNCRCLSVPAD